MPAPEVLPIAEPDLPELGRFLHENLNRRISPEAWVRALRHPWAAVRPNFGYQLRDRGRMVGAFCAIYSDQVIDGNDERFCNPHSWCVLKEYRRHGIGLILALLKQSGFHFTMLTPNPKVAEIFRSLKFKDLDDRIVTFPNLPSVRALARGRIVEADPGVLADRLTGAVRRDFLEHRDIPWLRFLAFGTPGDLCLVVYKRRRWKRMSCARLIHVSDPLAFERHAALMRSHLLMREGFLLSQVERRFLRSAPRLAHHGRRGQAKLYSSRSLTDAQITDLYSELAALDV